MHRIGTLARAVAAACVLALAAAACTGGGEAREPVRTPVVVDTDMGVDDVMAVLYLLRRPDVEVRAITVAGTGLAHCEAGVRHAVGLVALAGHEPVPVACGRERPLAGSAAFPDEWRAGADGLAGADLPPGENPTPASTAVDVLAEAIASAPRDVLLVTLGPLTNVGEALQRRPELSDRLAGIHAMAGAVDVPGNVMDNRMAEWNVWIDPHAANVVLDSGPPVTLVPLDATNHAPITEFFVEALQDHRDHPVAGLVYALFRDNPVLLEGGSYFWDPLAAVLATDPTLATFDTRRLRVAEGRPEIHGWTAPDSDGVRVRVAVAADGLAFEREFLNTLNGGSVVTSTRPRPDLSVTFDGRGCEYRGPRAVPPGRVVVEVRNEGADPVGVGVARLLDGRTEGDVEAFVAAGDFDRLPRWLRPVGDAGADPGTSGLAAWVLRAGRHAVACFVWAAGPRIWVLGELRVG